LHKSLHRLAAVGVGNPHHGGQGHLGMGVEHLFDLPRVAIESAHQDEILFAVRNHQVAIGVDVADVAG
jgi:hypothetical protein